MLATRMEYSAPPQPPKIGQALRAAGWGGVQARPWLETGLESTTRFESLIGENDTSAFNLNPLSLLAPLQPGGAQHETVADDAVAGVLEAGAEVQT